MLDLKYAKTKKRKKEKSRSWLYIFITQRGGKGKKESCGGHMHLSKMRNI